MFNQICINKEMLQIYIYIYIYIYIVNETIDIVINNIYNNPSLPPLKIKPNILRKILLACTTEVPFHDLLDNIYLHIYIYIYM